MTTTNPTTTRRPTMSENTTEITKPESIEQQVAAWSAERAEIADLAKAAEGVTVAGHADGPKAGREAVHNTLMPIWKRRCAIDSREKELLEIPKQISAQIKKTAADLSAPLLAVEDRLRKDRDAYDAEQERIKVDAKKAERLRIQSRVEAMVSAGLTPDIQRATHFSDELFSALIEDGKAEQTRRNRATEVSQELTALGDECTAAEAYDLTAEQAEHRLTVARKAFADREEAARIKKEEEDAEARRIADEADRKRNEEIEKERAARAKLEVGSRRSMELAALGSFVAMDECAEWTEEGFADALEEATAAKALRDQEAQRQREEAAKQASELRKLQDEADRRQKADDEAKEAARKAQEDKEAADKINADMQAEKARLEALKPDIEKAQAWFDACKNGIPSVPNVSDPEIQSALHRARVSLIMAIQEADFLPF